MVEQELNRGSAYLSTHKQADLRPTYVIALNRSRQFGVLGSVLLQCFFCIVAGIAKLVCLVAICTKSLGNAGRLTVKFFLHLELGSAKIVTTTTTLKRQTVGNSKPKVKPHNKAVNRSDAEWFFRVAPSHFTNTRLP